MLSEAKIYIKIGVVVVRIDLCYINIRLTQLLVPLDKKKKWVDNVKVLKRLLNTITLIVGNSHVHDEKVARV